MDTDSPKKVLRIGRGFTLIELLVVIAIIGILASIVLASLVTARSKGRDARRIAQMDEIRKALDLYYSDNGRYVLGPSILDGQYAKEEDIWFGIFGSMVHAQTASNIDGSDGMNSKLELALYPEYLPAVSDGPYFYEATGNGKYYCLGVELENAGSVPSGGNIFCAGSDIPYPENVIALDLDFNRGYAIGNGFTGVGS